MKNEKEIEQLEDVSTNDNNKTEPVEKIEIVEHVESKYDNIVPRTEMGEMSKKEKEEIRSKVLGEDIASNDSNTGISTDIKTVSNETTQELKKPGGNNIVTIIVVILAIVLVIAGFYMFIILPSM